MDIKHAVSIVTFSLISSSLFAEGKWGGTVQTIDWSRFEKPDQISDAFVLSSKINANAARYTHS